MINEPVRPPSDFAAAESFDAVVLPHLDAGYRLARWIMRNEHDAEDVVQEASLRALRYFATFSGGNGRAWFLRIVRNTCWGWGHPRLDAATDQFDEAEHSIDGAWADPEALLLRTDDVRLTTRTLNALPDRFRELLVLRELEDHSYREMSDVMRIPIGTVMSGLSRARQAFRGALDIELKRVGIEPQVQPRKRRRSKSRLEAHREAAATPAR